MANEKIKKVNSPAGSKPQKVTKSARSSLKSTSTASVTEAPASRREIVGIVVSDKMQKTIVVRVDRKVRDPEYKKFVVRSQRVKAHDEGNVAKVGDQVLLIASRPISKDKRWALKRLLRRDGELVKVNIAN